MAYAAERLAGTTRDGSVAERLRELAAYIYDRGLFLGPEPTAVTR